MTSGTRKPGDFHLSEWTHPLLIFENGAGKLSVFWSDNKPQKVI